jgi:hypothetical protein
MIGAAATNTKWAAKPKAVASAIRSIIGERPTSHSEPSTAPRRSGIRASRGSDSGISAVSTITRIPYSPTPANTQRQSPSSSSHPPSTGAITGASAKIIITRAMSRCASAPENRSRTTTRETIVAAPALTPCSTRSAMSAPMPVASVAPSIATT